MVEYLFWKRGVGDSNSLTVTKLMGVAMLKYKTITIDQHDDLEYIINSHVRIGYQFVSTLASNGKIVIVFSINEQQQMLTEGQSLVR